MRFMYAVAATTLLVSSCAVLTDVARADTFLLHVSGPTLTLSATVTGLADPYATGAFDLTSGSGIANGVNITLYTPSGNSRQSVTSPDFPPASKDISYTYDNVLFASGGGPTGLDLDSDGLLFTWGTDHINLIAQGGYSFIDDETISGFSGDGLSTFSVTPVSGVTPEPSSIALLGTGLLGMGGLVRRRVRRG